MTIRNISKIECTGCGACENVCPVKCIFMQVDREGFRYPVIDESRCINCGNCESVCTNRKKACDQGGKNVKVFAAYTKDKKILNYSSSGGVFAIIAEKFLREGGIVYGAKLENLKVMHVRICDEKNLPWIQKSKYLQSNVSLMYKQTKLDLENGYKVLFSGTPCQIAGLYAYLGKTYDNLVTCDVVCHGVPSEKVFEKFVRYEEKKYHSKMINLYWRDKRNGWHRNSIIEIFANGREIVTQSYSHSFQRGFLDNLYLRPSCYECQFCGIPRVADISLADYWQADKHNAEFASRNADEGISAIIASGDVGIELFEKIKEHCVWKEMDVSIVKECSRHSWLPPLKNKDRELFFEDFPKKSYKILMKKYIFANEEKMALSLRCKILLKKKMEQFMQGTSE